METNTLLTFDLLYLVINMQQEGVKQYVHHNDSLRIHHLTYFFVQVFYV